MIDYFALALTHGLIVIALLRIVRRPELDRELWDAPFMKGNDDDPTANTKARRRRQRRRDA